MLFGEPIGRMRIARDLRPWFGTAKVGLELYSSVGPDAVTALTDLGYDVFADLKFYDIPTTVNKGARVIGSLGARYLNFHAQGGAPMLRDLAEPRRGQGGRAGGVHRTRTLGGSRSASDGFG